MKRFLSSVLAISTLAVGQLSMAQPIDPSLFSQLTWRNIGPFRGGRVSAVTGVIGQPGVFYMGLPLGGVWRTTGAGTTWEPIMDSVKEASCVGAIEVAPSDPNIIYVGMGDLITGGGINEGNGVYKSTDAGKTWQHLGLDETRQIPSILVDPHDPNLVMVAAQGNIRAKSDARGLFRSTDGGKTWTKTLYVDDETGIQKITWAQDNPKVMLATTVRHYTAPGTRGGGFGGPAGGTHLFKSMDQGITWTEIKGGGLPELAGRTSVAIAMGTNSQRMFIVGNFGLYRSDDGGTSWRQMDKEDRRVGNGQGGYNCGVYVNPKNPDIVYVVNTCLYRSLDGGNTFTGFKGAPGGDDPQQLWFDPTDGNRFILGADQGATVTLDGGLTWSSWYNQSTAQVYHISADNQFPYWVYATQQDSGSIGTASRGNLGAITPLDWVPHPGYEFGSIVADPLNPKVTYAGGAGGGIDKVTYPGGEAINVSPNIEAGASLRKAGNQPLMFSPKNPHELMAGFQFLMSTTDGGKTWKKLSSDLGFPKGVTPPKPGEQPARRAGGNEVLMGFGDEEEQEMELQQANAAGGSIESFSPSSIDAGVIWVGTTNGLIKVTKDHGKSWEDVTIPNLPNPTQADISAIDASHQEKAEAYVAIDYHRTGDYTPWFYRTRDFGKTWTKIVEGLPTDMASGSFARVIRADTKRKGLVFAGTESFVYVSFDDGDHWQSLALNLPNTSYRDMLIKGNDLVVGTYGRGFWILDDISPLREVAASIQSESVHFYKPAEAIRVRRNVNGDTPFPPEVPHALNPPLGAVIDYWLGKEAKSVVLEVYDSANRLVRKMSNYRVPPIDEPPLPAPDWWMETPKPLPATAGSHRINWNLRHDNPPAFSHSYAINANPHQTPASPEGLLVIPGLYTLKLTVDGSSTSQTVEVKADPRSLVGIQDLKKQYDTKLQLNQGTQQAWDSFHEIARLRAKLADLKGSGPDDEVAKGVADLDAKLSALAGSTGGGRRFGGGGPGGGQLPAPSFTGTHGAILRLLTQLDSGDMAPNDPTKKAVADALVELSKLVRTFEELKTKDLNSFNELLVKHNLKPIT